MTRLVACIGYLVLVAALVLLRVGDAPVGVMIGITSLWALIAARVAGPVVLAMPMLAAVVLALLNLGVDDGLGRGYNSAFLVLGFVINLAAALVGLGWKAFAWTSDKEERRAQSAA